MKPSCRVALREDYVVRAIPYAQAKALVVQHHYARGASNTGTAFGLVSLENELLGAALWIPPTKTCAQSVSRWAGEGYQWQEVLSLTRLVVVPGQPQNATGILLSSAMRQLDKRWRLLVTYADSRMGHTGTIYRATNWQDLGETKGDPVWVDSEGRQVSRKAGPVSRSAAQMLELGYKSLGPSKKRKFVYRRA